MVKNQPILGFDNAKTIKGEKYNYQTAIIYMASHKQSGFNVCAEASKQCSNDCLFFSGYGAFKFTQEARIKKTKRYFEERKNFMNQLKHEINLFVKRSKKNNITPCVRLNGTSDLPYEFQVIEALQNGANVSVVFEKHLPKTWNGYEVINGDKHDLRFLDKSNVIVGLTHKKTNGRKQVITNDSFIIKQ